VTEETEEIMIAETMIDVTIEETEEMIDGVEATEEAEVIEEAEVEEDKRLRALSKKE
jgi:hypothetical protein